MTVSPTNTVGLRELCRREQAMERSYIAFISYKHVKRDAAIAKQVHTLIENYVIPKSLRKDSKKLAMFCW
jgi:hypothetical protein